LGFTSYTGSSKVDKLKETATEFCTRLGRYRQPFLWSAIPIFNASLELDVGQDPRDCSLQPLMRYENEKVLFSCSFFVFFLLFSFFPQFPESLLLFFI